MSLGDAQILDLKDAIVAAFRPMENLFVVMGSASVAEGGETARLCSEIGQELARAFAPSSMPPWTGWQPRDTTADVARARPGILVYSLR